MLSDMGMMIDRRRVMGKKNTPYLPDYTLIHHWEAADGLIVSNKVYWVDRVQGKRFEQYTQNAPQVVDGMLKLNLSHYLIANLNEDVPINMGDVWQVDVEFKVDAPPTENLYIVDFGSVYNASHAFEPCCINSRGNMTFNPKFTGNTSSALYNVEIPFTTYGELSKVSVGMEKVNDSTYQPYYILNGVRYDSPNTTTVQDATFNGNFDTDYGRVGCAATVGYGSNDWRYVKSIKIYKKVQA